MRRLRDGASRLTLGRCEVGLVVVVRDIGWNLTPIRSANSWPALRNSSVVSGIVASDQRATANASSSMA
jgi:hypothetical protein